MVAVRNARAQGTRIAAPKANGIVFDVAPNQIDGMKRGE